MRAPRLVLAVLAVLVAVLAVVALRREPASPAPVAPAPEAAKPRAKKKARPPKEKPCLAPPTDAGEEGMVASAGLAEEDVRRVMRAAAQTTLGCFEGAPSATLMLSLNVACSGRVARVDVEDDGGASPDVAACVREALMRAEFPAHALPDGDTIRYPLAYTAPG